MDKRDIRRLIELHLNGGLADHEREQLLLLVKNDNLLIEEVLNELIAEQTADAENTDVHLMQETLRKVLSADKISYSEKIRERKTITRFKWWWAAAAILIGAGIIFYPSEEKANSEITQTEIQPVNKKIEAPQTNRATVTLSDGTVLYLDTFEDGEIAENGNVKLVKLEDGRLAYEKDEMTAMEELQYNTLTNPRGSKIISLILSDGTRVWLNSESSITYPVAFVGNERNVTLRGEGYFEVVHNPSKPFMVDAGGMNIKVLGTEFNVNAYADLGAIMTTLINGSLEVNNNRGSVIKLTPGMQGSMKVDNLHLEVKSDVDVNQVIAWKNGYFSFRNSSLKEVMQQVSRWYDVNVIYEGMIEPRQFRGIVSKTSKLEEVLQILEESKVRFKVEGRTLKVRP